MITAAAIVVFLTTTRIGTYNITRSVDPCNLTTDLACLLRRTSIQVQSVFNVILALLSLSTTSATIHVHFMFRNQTKKPSRLLLKVTATKHSINVFFIDSLYRLCRYSNHMTVLMVTLEVYL